MAYCADVERLAEYASLFRPTHRWDECGERQPSRNQHIDGSAISGWEGSESRAVEVRAEV